MKTYNGHYLGICIDNNDPEFRGRIQVFIPHLMPALYEGWNKTGENISIDCIGDNMPQGLTSDIVQRLRQILPWAESASPIVGQSSSGGVMSALAKAIKSIGQATAGAISEVGHAAAGALNMDQSPSAIPEGSLPPGTTCNLPVEGSHVDTKNLKPKFTQRLNGFFQEATSLGYKVICSSGYRSYEKQAALFAQIGRPGCAPPGGSSHEYGIAVDLKVTGNGVSITQISTKNDTSNKDTPEFRALLAKYGLHQPLHPQNNPSGPEKWHIEPSETPKAGGPRGKEATTRVAALMSGEAASDVAETTSSSQFPPAGNPLISKSPTSTKESTPTAPTTGMTPVAPVPNTLSGNTPAAEAAAASTGTPVTSGPASDSTSTEGQSQLAKDRIARFEHELKDPQVLDRMEYVLKREGGASARLILETVCNRAMFGNHTLKSRLFQKGYFKTSKDPNATATTPHTNFTLDMIQKVIYNGANETGLATDQGYNDKTLFMKKFIDSGVTGSWFNLLNGQKITDPAMITKLSTTPGSGNEEFIYQKCGSGDGSSDEGKAAKKYGIKYNLQASSPASITGETPLPPEIADARKSDLTQKEVGSMPPPATVGKTDPHGPTVVKNTNDAAKGMFAFPGVGAMVWVFFREGNPQFPVYFAASYGANEWKSAYHGNSLNPEGTNNGTVGSQMSNSMKLNPNAGGGLEFTHVKDASDPTGSKDKAIAMMYGDDGSNMMFSKGYHQIYTRHDRRDQIDGHLYNIIGGAEEKWVEDDSSVNIRGNVVIKIGKIDNESIEAMKELADFSKQMNDTLMSNSAG